MGSTPSTKAGSPDVGKGRDETPEADDDSTNETPRARRRGSYYRNGTESAASSAARHGLGLADMASEKIKSDWKLKVLLGAGIIFFLGLGWAIGVAVVVWSAKKLVSATNILDDVGRNVRDSVLQSDFERNYYDQTKDSADHDLTDEAMRQTGEHDRDRASVDDEVIDKLWDSGPEGQAIINVHDLIADAEARLHRLIDQDVDSRDHDGYFFATDLLTGDSSAEAAREQAMSARHNQRNADRAKARHTEHFLDQSGECESSLEAAITGADANISFAGHSGGVADFIAAAFNRVASEDSYMQHERMTGETIRWYLENPRHMSDPTTSGPDLFDPTSVFSSVVDDGQVPESMWRDSHNPQFPSVEARYDTAAAQSFRVQVLADAVQALAKASGGKTFDAGDPAQASALTAALRSLWDYRHGTTTEFQNAASSADLFDGSDAAGFMSAADYASSAFERSAGRVGHHRRSRNTDFKVERIHERRAARDGARYAQGFSRTFGFS